uniref:Smr domain-containing protein n=1 Tax=Steinernema glaseri TaxID=37863 RepID=A0A1I7YE63_9BILA
MMRGCLDEKHFYEELFEEKIKAIVWPLCLAELHLSVHNFENRASELHGRRPYSVQKRAHQKFPNALLIRDGTTSIVQSKLLSFLGSVGESKVSLRVIRVSGEQKRPDGPLM